ncbi:hypothetical protein AXG93_2035s1630 [Marchantia polymorpha subsp. ruderalis]|uniref:Uncharacterized protein n=1 Tax=Marchantia polymorpha subsp. ruderalis TaxID=1480154 RepID=A0A176VPD8_MARPO|nr:hypothetical protein AXG93_2035s1630 [Marchantia polymorpha subsp. ruderalis]
MICALLVYHGMSLQLGSANMAKYIHKYQIHGNLVSDRIELCTRRKNPAYGHREQCGPHPTPDSTSVLETKSPVTTQFRDDAVHPATAIRGAGGWFKSRNGEGPSDGGSDGEHIRVTEVARGGGREVRRAAMDGRTDGWRTDGQGPVPLCIPTATARASGVTESHSGGARDRTSESGLGLNSWTTSDDGKRRVQQKQSAGGGRKGSSESGGRIGKAQSEIEPVSLNGGSTSSSRSKMRSRDPRRD